ncbi:TauD/TfdA family dioxygenase [Sorangium sp. So ce1182]|uniref:TauD/TfdA family dioxygenase n=1 Tax=Sorangium sp. So ce1182 TaxID=3133334 RepID=UPI003F6434F9
MRSPGSPRLNDVSVREVMGLLKEYGVVYFEGFDVDLRQFEQYAKQFEASAQITLAEDLEKGYVDASTQGEVQAQVQLNRTAAPLITREVNPSQNALHVHSENSYLPFPPDLLWFYCVQPAQKEGRTTVVDGVQLLEEMDPSIRDLFRTKKISYRQTWPRDGWQRLLKVDDIVAAQQFVSMLPGVSAEILGDSLRVRHTISAIKETRLGGKPAFVNSVLYAYDLPENYGLCMEDDTPIPASIVEHLRDLVDRIKIVIPWKGRDCALIDNSRMLHGREAFHGDTQRKVRAMEIQAAVQI